MRTRKARGSRRCSMRSPQSTTSKDAVLERQLQLLDVADDHLLADGSRDASGVRVTLDADDGAAALDEWPREVAARAPDVEDSLVRADQLEERAWPPSGRAFSWT